LIACFYQIPAKFGDFCEKIAAQNPLHITKDIYFFYQNIKYHPIGKLIAFILLAGRKKNQKSKEENMKSVKKILMLGVMTLASISMFVGLREAKAGQFVYGNSDKENTSQNGVTCPMYDASGQLLGTISISVQEINGEYYKVSTMNWNDDGSSLSGTIPLDNPMDPLHDGVSLVSMTPVEDAVGAFPELATLSGVDFTNDVIVTVSANQTKDNVEAKGGSWIGTKSAKKYTHITIRCAYLMDSSTGHFKRCLHCLYFVE
jgi:hypothetical protein